MPRGELWPTKLYGPHAYKPQYGVPRNSHVENPEYQVSELCLDSPWPARNAPCFALLNTFMERCNDCLELVQTTQHFRLLADAAEVGGAGSRSLDALVREIHVRYSAAMDEFFKNVGNVLDLDNTHIFERAFFQFRSVVKVSNQCSISLVMYPKIEIEELHHSSCQRTENFIATHHMNYRILIILAPRVCLKASISKMCGRIETFSYFYSPSEKTTEKLLFLLLQYDRRMNCI